MAILAPDSRYRMVNRAFLQMLNHSQEELRTRAWENVTHLADLKMDRFQLEKRYLNRQGETIWASLNVSSFRDAIAGAGSRFVIVENITGRKRAGKKLARQAHELPRSKADLQQFAYVTSHDLLEPLGNIAAFSEIISRGYRGCLDADADEFIGYIATGVDRMRSLFEDLLGYLRVANSARAPLAGADVRLAVDWALNNLRHSVESGGAVIHCERLPTVTGDQVLLVQLFQNLIGNAIKYRSALPPEIHISAEVAGTEWGLSVKDNGIGIAPQHHERIFGAFMRLHESGIPGTGIGLAICRKIVGKHNGRIWVESKVGRGAIFRFTVNL